MQIVTKKNAIVILSAILIVALAFMAFSLTKKMNINIPRLTPFEKEIDKIESQSTSTELESIESDLTQTDLTSLDQELQDIDNELEQGY